MLSRTSRLRSERFLAPLLALFLGAACSRGQEATPQAVGPPRCEPLERSEPARARDLVFVLADTTRRDRVGLHGGAAHTPRLDALAREGVFFTAAGTPAPWTKPAIASLFTGLLPSAHGVISHPAFREAGATLDSDVLDPRHQTLAEALAAAGYQTAAFVSNPWIQRQLGFQQGFEVWDESLAGNATPGEAVTRAGLDWLGARGDEPRPFFLYLHYMDPHQPYHRVPEAALEARRDALAADTRPLDARGRARIARIARGEDRAPLVSRGIAPSIALLELVYDVGIEHFDRALGALLDGLAARPGSDEIALVVTSDHGEALHERGWGDHGHGLYEEETGIPLVLRLPGVATHGAISCPVDLIDLRRTLCDYLAVPCAGGDRGTSLFSPALADPQRTLVAEGVKGRPRDRSVRDPRYKLLFRPGREGPGARDAGPPFRLFDLARDPGEQTNLLASPAEPAGRAAFERLRARATAPIPGPAAPPGRTELDAETRRRLEALGYLDRDP